jgi:protein involved in polysaccharide export with SLBB domain
MQSTLAVLALALLVTAHPSALAAQQVPTRPAGVTDQQIQGAIQQRGLGDLIRQRIQTSGQTPDQIRARLRAAGYSESLIDQYLTQGQAGQSAPAPTAEMLQALSSLGISDFALAQDTVAPAVTGPAPAEGGTPALFGLDVFRRSTTQFAPVLTGPVDSEYRLGPGDELVLILTGDVELAHQLPVTREGFVVIPQVGQIYVANLTMDQLRELLYARLGRVYSGVRRGAGATTQFQMSVSRVRMNQIFVTGEVARPGAYGVSSLGTVMNALYQAGGPTERGNFRAVRVMRGGRLVRTLDLYDYLLQGNTRDDIRLEQGDVLFLPPRGRRVTVEGEVLRPAIYELAEGQGLRELIQMAGGLLPQAFTGRAQIERVLPPERRVPGGRDRTVLDVDLSVALAAGGAAVALEPEDRLRVFPVTLPVRERVTLRGNVWRPGTYQLEPGMRLSQLIGAAGGVKTDTYTKRAHILRLMPDSTRRLIAVDLGIAAGAAADPELMEYDEIAVYSLTEFRPGRQVFIYGSVQRPGPFVYRDSMTLRDLVIQAGGLRDEAYLLEAEIARVADSSGNGRLATIRKVPLDSTYVLDATGRLARPTGARGAEPALEPYDNVFIRRVPGYELPRNVVLSGEVRFPGRYALTRRGETLLDVVNRAGGLTENAYVRGAQFFRAEGRAGRVGIDLERVLREARYRDNLALFPGDSLHVPQYQPVVAVEGAVNSPVAVAYVPNRSAGYYVDRAGGYARRADKGRTYIVQLNGAVMRRSSTVEPGARVVVPEVPAGEEKTNWGQVLSGVATILTSALTIILVVQRL